MGARIAEARTATQAAVAATAKAKAGPALFDRDGSGRMGFAYYLDAADAQKTAGRLWRIIETTEGKEDKALADHAKEMVGLHRDQTEHLLSLVPTTAGGGMLPELASQLEFGRRIEQRIDPGITTKDAEKRALEHLGRNPRHYSEVSAHSPQQTAPKREASADQLAAQALSELEAMLRRNPPAGTTADDVGRVFRAAGSELAVALTNLIREARATPEEKARKLTSAAGRALRSLNPARVARLEKVAEAGEKGFSSPHRQVSPQEAAAWTRELKKLESWELLVNSNGWWWRLTPLGQRVVELAREKRQGQTLLADPAQLAAHATKYRKAGGPLPATPKSTRMVLGGRVLKLPDDALGPLVELLNRPRVRKTYPDGRWIAEPGDAVYVRTRSFGGTPGSISGEVEQSRGGGLRVRVTGSGGLFPTSVKAKTMAYSEDWTVVDDPRPEQIREERNKRELEQADQSRREQEADVADGRRRAAEAVARGEAYITADTPVGVAITDHVTGEVGVLASRHPNTVVRWEHDLVERLFPEASATATVGLIDRKSFLPQYRSLRAVLWPDGSKRSPSEEQNRQIVVLAKELRSIIDGEIQKAGFFGSAPALNQLAALVQQQLLQPQYLGLPGLVEKRGELIASLLDEGVLRSLG